MILDWARNGTHSALAVFRMARAMPSMRHAVKAAPRAWWGDTVRKHGSRRPVFRTRRALLDAGWMCNVYSIPAWEIIAPSLGASSSGWFEAWIARETRGEWAEIWLADPYLVLGFAGEEWGLSCAACGKVEQTYVATARFLCRKCAKPRKGELTEAHVAARLLKRMAFDKQKQARDRKNNAASVG
jgi:hypothetical protein